MAQPNTKRPLRVFLCHASVDKPAVRELYQRLRAIGIDAWLDEENLLPGQDWQREIPKAVRASDVVIVCLSQGSINKAGYIQKEIKFALDAAEEQPEDTIFVIPLKLKECNVPERLSRWQWVDLFKPNGYERLRRALQVRETSLDLRVPSSAAPASQAEPDITPSQSISNVSGGINVDADHVNVGNDMVGRDKIIQANMYIEHATIIQSSPQGGDTQVIAPIKSNIEIRKFGDMEFVLVPAGKFLMGSKGDDREALAHEKPQHVFEIPYDYWMARYLVTNEQSAKFFDRLADAYLGENWKTKADHPVVSVRWYTAIAYCNWLNEQLRSDLGQLVLHLPTEAEWEKAARGPDGRLFPWGNDFDTNKCNSFEDGKLSTTPVGAYSPRGDSPYGCADMAGNVWEWTHSLFKDYPYNPLDGREDPASTHVRVLRGGAFIGGGDVRCASRFKCNPDSGGTNIGFRVMLSGL